MSNAKFSVVFPIIFLIMFALVEDNMGCEASLGDCRICGIKCSYYGRHAEAHCIGGICVCDYPCKPPPKL
ncbi:unnamed protein product [Brassica rapa]|uniref:Uncharacterized protein n=1 Tax=Brassica campestris TaxID=3711 RepID=A0A3P5ZQ78_BRACM|nr:unnamed protein product [Brassica rapa]VDC82467.1 unnamed protein product [Brassica rapa]